jgi:DNA-binding transcriptional ArsR family regulator
MGDNNNDRNENPGYYAVIPANVRYDKSLSPNAKLLYGEITALTKKEGFCWASNSYFASLYGVDKSSVSHWIKSLAKAGYVRIEFVYADGRPNIEKRKIYIADPLPGQAACGKVPAAGGGEISHQGGELIHQGVVKYLNGGGEKSPERILQSNNTEEAAADQIPPKSEKPPPEAAAGPLTGKNQKQEKPAAEEAEALKLHFKKLNPLLVFDEHFYPRALRFLSSRGVDFGYASWLCKTCAEKKPDNLAGYIYKVFFEERYILLYREALKPPPEVPAELFSCPACGAEYARDKPECPACGLERGASISDVAFKKKFLSLPPDMQDKYLKKQGQIVSGLLVNYSSGNSEKLAALNREFGLIDAGAG